MKKELVHAVNFLVDLLRVNNSNLSDEQLNKFRQNVYDCLWQHYENHWFPDSPLRGSGYRCIRINGTLDPLIERAGKLVGLATPALRALFPTELTMWVDPSDVAYRIGENGSICSLYEKAPLVAEDSSSSKTVNASCSSSVGRTSPVKTNNNNNNTPSKAHQQLSSSPPFTPRFQQGGVGGPLSKQPFSPSRTPLPPHSRHHHHQQQQFSPPRSPVFDTYNNSSSSPQQLKKNLGGGQYAPQQPAPQQQQQQQQQQHVTFFGSQANCKEAALRSNFESSRLIERLFVSS